MITVNIVLNLIGVRGYLTQSGIDYQALMIFCLVWGMVGSFISLLLSKRLIKWQMNLRTVGADSQRQVERDLYHRVNQLSAKAGLPNCPEVAIYDSAELNAFATGPTKSNSLVAVSSGLLSSMNKTELDGVLAHEVSHIANGDMVTMTLLQGIINAFVLFFAKAAAWAIASSDNEEGGHSYGFQHIMIEIGLQIVFSLIGSVIVAWFSRHREFRADAGASQLVGASSMISALSHLQNYSQIPAGNQSDDKAIAAFKISGRENWMALLSTHPSIERRISALKNR